MSCPYCQCGDACGREPSGVPDHDRSGRVLEAVLDLYSKHPWVLDLDPLHVVGELIMRGYFGYYDLPTLVDVGGAQDIIREVEGY